MVTSNIVLADFAEKFGSLRAYVTPEILNWINNSETLKGQLRNYLNDPKTARVVVSGGEQSAAAAYQFPTLTGSGFATFGIDRLTRFAITLV